MSRGCRDAGGIKREGRYQVEVSWSGGIRRDGRYQVKIRLSKGIRRMGSIRWKQGGQKVSE